MKFYRYELGHVKNLFDISWEAEVKLTEFELVKETPKGYWIAEHCATAKLLGSKPVWVSKTSRKRFAYPTKEEAMISAKARTKRRVGFLKRDLAIAESFLYNLEVEEDETKVVNLENHERQRIYNKILNRKME